MKREQVFSDIYKDKTWQNYGTASGEGTRPTALGLFLGFLFDFLQKNTHFKGIIDIGCGDWRQSCQINRSLRELRGPRNLVFIQFKLFEKSRLRRFS
jgi:hypothetical protein